MPLLFRIAGLIVAVVTGAIGMAELVAGGPTGLAKTVPALPPDKRVIGFYLVILILTSVLLLFCALFWLAPTRTRDPKPNWRLRLILGTQLVIGVFFADLMILVACEAGYLLTTRARSRWMYVQVVFFLAFIIVGGTQGWLTAAPELARIPRAPGIGLTVLQVLAWQLFSFSAGYLAGREVEARRELSLANGELLATQLVLADSARISERLNIARELHDTIGHHLAALSLKLQLAGRLAEGPAQKPVQDAHLVAKLLLSDVRAAVSSMREEGAVDLAGALKAICAAIDRPKIELQMTEADMIRDPAKAQILLRCAQEAITNSIRHSQASSILLRLQSIGASVELEVRDNGQGSARLSPGNGLRGMRERVEAVGGKLAIDTAPGKGFRLLAQLPVADAAL